MKKIIASMETKKVNLARRSKFFFATVDADNNVEFLTKGQFDKLDLPMETVGEHTQKEVLRALLAQIKQFNHKVDYNTWCKKAERSFMDKVEKLMGMGAKWTKAGLLTVE